MSLSPGIRVSCSGKSNKAPQHLPSAAGGSWSKAQLLLGLQAWKSSHFLYTPPLHPAPVLPPAAALTLVEPSLLSTHNLYIFYIFAYYTVAGKYVSY